jgi:hypothetical protein
VKSSPDILYILMEVFYFSFLPAVSDDKHAIFVEENVKA